MELEQGQPTIAMYGQNGALQIRLAIVAGHANSAELILGSPDGRAIASIVVDGDPNYDGTVTLGLLGHQSKRIIVSTNLPGAQPTVLLNDEQGSTISQLPTP